MRRVLAMALTLAGLVAPDARAEPARLAFDHAGAIWTMDAGGNDRRRLVRGHAAAFSPDGRSIAFVRYTSDTTSELWVAAADGSGERRLFAPAKTFVFAPAWSPDGSLLATAAARFTERGVRSSLDVLRPDGGDRRTVRTLRNPRDLSFITAAAWGPRGDELFYTRSDFVDASIRAIRLDGGADRRFLSHARNGVFSPDGSRFAFGDTSARHGESCGSDECSVNAELAVLEAGGLRRRLTRTTADESDPQWSPDGTRLAFSSGRNLRATDFPAREVYSIAADGSCLTWLTNGDRESGSASWIPGPGEAAPARCGEADRAPLIERPPPGRLWLGRQVGNALFRGSFRGGVAYDDCAAFDPADCPPGFTVTFGHACADEPARTVQLRPFRRARLVAGRLVGTSRHTFIAGATLADVEFTSSGPRAARLRVFRQAVRRLRAVSGVALGRPRLPARRRARLPGNVRAHVRPC